MGVVKCCSVCGVVKSLDDFHRKRGGADGRASRCKECTSTYYRRYREENRDKVRERKRRYYEENRDKIAERARRYREENRDKVEERKRSWYEANRDKVRERRRRYYEENRDKARERSRQYSEENQEYVKRLASRGKSRRQSVTESAATKRGPWSEVEIAILMADDGRTLVAKALELGRTYYSCVDKRACLRRAGATN